MSGVSAGMFTGKNSLRLIELSFRASSAPYSRMAHKRLVTDISSETTSTTLSVKNILVVRCPASWAASSSDGRRPHLYATLAAVCGITLLEWWFSVFPTQHTSSPLSPLSAVNAPVVQRAWDSRAEIQWLTKLEKVWPARLETTYYTIWQCIVARIGPIISGFSVVRRKRQIRTAWTEVKNWISEVGDRQLPYVPLCMLPPS